MNEDNSEQYYISKLYAPIMENCFYGSGIRLRWGDTIPLVRKKLDYDFKTDIRVTIPAKKSLDFSVIKYAKKPSQKESSNMKQVPAILIARLENEILLYYQIDNNWCVIDKVKDADAPNSVQVIKERAIKAYIKYLYLITNVSLHRIFALI